MSRAVSVLDFGAGIYRGREAPENAAYDLVNLLLDDEGQPFRRGGSAYLSTADAGATLVGLADASLAPGPRTAAWTAAPSLVALDASNAPVVITTSAFIVPRPLLRPVVIAGMLVSLAANGNVVAYGGARTSATSSAGTVTVTKGSTQVVGVGTNFTAVGPGAIFDSGSSGGDERVGVVKQVDSATLLTLAEPWPFATAAGAAYILREALGLDIAAALGGGTRTAVGVAGTSPRLFIGEETRVIFSQPGTPLVFTRPAGLGTQIGDYLQLPSDALVQGLEGIGGAMMVFTTRGVYLIDNIDFDPTDAVGNTQWTVRQVNELVLWGEAGLAQWRGASVVPAVDDVWLMPAGDAPVPISVGIRPLYRSYVKAGYSPGIATVHRGHYFLPIVNGTTWVDTLVCRIDRDFAWTRWSGHGAGVAYSQRIGSATRSPKFYSVAAQRVTDLTDAWSPSASNASEANATTHSISIESRDLPTPGPRSKGAPTRNVRIRYEATAAGAVSFTTSYARGPEGAAYTSLGAAIRGGGTSDGLDESVWPVAKQAPAIRFKLESASALSTFTLRSIEARYG